MKNEKFSVPVLLIIFNRSDYIQQILEVLKSVQVQNLYIVADGPRNKNDDLTISKSKKLINNISWKCNISTNYAKKNLGPKRRLSSGITWFFDNVNEGIILEHDCLPHLSFFNFCKILLKKYRQNKKVMHISGNNFLFNKIDIDDSYYFSQIPHIWGWASWARAWKSYDTKMKSFPKFKKRQSIKKLFSNSLFQNEWLKLFQATYDNKIKTWDYQWTYSLFKKQGLAINPVKNLVQNIGFDKDAQNTTNSKSKFANMAVYDLNNISHPKTIIINHQADKIIMQQNFKMTIKKILSQKVFWPWRWIKYTSRHYWKKFKHECFTN